ncbi:MAG: hypothetical protein ACE366_12265 [Bradymonadia bacterium]
MSRRHLPRRGLFTPLIIALTLSLGVAHAAPVDDTARRLMEYVPADTPYAFVGLESFPEAITKKMTQAVQPTLDQLKTQMAELEKTPGQSKGDRVIQAVVQEMFANVDDAMNIFGMGPDSRMVIYGLGFLPAARITLKDPKRLQSFIGKVEKRSEVKFDRKQFDSVSYYSFGDAELQVALAIINNDLVIGASPTSMTEEVWPQLFGLRKPLKTTLNQSGKIDDLIKRHNLNSFAVGFLDHKAIAQLLMGDNTGLGQKMATALGYKVKLDATCKAEVYSLVDYAPRSIIDYRIIGEQEIRSDLLFETEAALTHDLAGLTTRVPGLGGAQKSHLGEMAFALDVNGMFDLLGRRAKAAAAKPFTCPDLQGLNEMATNLSRDLGNGTPAPAAAFAKGFRGLHAVIEDGRMTKDKSFEAKGFVHLSHDTPMTFMGILGIALPALGQAGLTDDGKVVDVKLPKSQSSKMDFSAVSAVAVRGKGMVVGSGKGMKGRITGVLDAPAPGPAPVFLFNYDAGRFLKLIGDTLPPDATEREAMESLLSVFGATGYGVYFTDRGPMIRSTIFLR